MLKLNPACPLYLEIGGDISLRFDTGAQRVQQRLMTIGDQGKGDSGWQHADRIPGTDKAAFTLDIARRPPVPVVIAVPHAGRCYPQFLVERMRHADYACARLEDRLVDKIGSAVARQTGAALLIANAPRAMIDLNRSPDDVDWEMVRGGAPSEWRSSFSSQRARGGLGLVPRRLAGLGEIWRGQISGDELQDRVARLHIPYHRALGLMLERLRDRWGAALLIDLHSMPPLKTHRPCEQPAQFVIGDRFGGSCDGMLAAGSLRYLAQQGRRGAHNRPYAGGYVLDRHGLPRRNIHALQLEICRSTYLEPDCSRLGTEAQDIVQLIGGLVQQLAADVAAMGGQSHIDQAAE